MRTCVQTTDSHPPPAACSQLDNHIPALSVLDTLEFAHICQVGFKSENYNLVNQLQDAVIKAGFEQYQSGRIAAGQSGETRGGPPARGAFGRSWFLGTGPPGPAGGEGP